jgi:lipopolysaccharide export system protein LptA
MARPLSAGALALLLAALGLAWGCAGRGLQPREAQGIAEPGALPTPTPVPTATPAPQFPQNRPLDESRPLKVRSARLRFDQRSQLTVFYGGVTVTHDSSTLLAKELRSSDQGRSAEASGGVLLRDTQRQFTAEAGRVRYGNALQEGQLEDGVRLISLDPYGRPVTVTGRSGGYQGLSGTAWVDGGVQALRGDLAVTAGRAEMEEAGALLRLLQAVDLRLGVNRAVADRVDLWRDGQSLALSGNVRALFTPAELRQAAERPWSDPSKEAQ